MGPNLDDFSAHVYKHLRHPTSQIYRGQINKLAKCLKILITELPVP